MTAFETARAHMIDSQLRPNRVADERVLAAIARVPRELFVAERLRSVAYIDDDLPLGGGRYLMEPMVAARLLQAASVERSDIALVVGAGAGYEAAVLAHLARAVVALEDDPELARRMRDILVDLGIAAVSAVEGPLIAGHRSRAPYDVILFGGAVAEVPNDIMAQLAEGGRLVAVVKLTGGVGRAILTTKTGGVIARRVMFDAATPLLPGLQPKPAFVF